MAKAPRPGVSKRADEIDAAKTITRIRLRDDTWDVALGNLPMRVKNRVRKQCDGLPITAFWGSPEVIDEDSFKVLVWVARVTNGEDSLTLQEVDESWPDDLTVDDIGMAPLDDTEAAEAAEDNPES